MVNPAPSEETGAELSLRLLPETIVPPLTSRIMSKNLEPPRIIATSPTPGTNALPSPLEERKTFAEHLETAKEETLPAIEEKGMTLLAQLNNFVTPPEAPGTPVVRGSQTVEDDISGVPLPRPGQRCSRARGLADRSASRSMQRNFRDDLSYLDWPYRKQSNSDLQSRLKTRKLLGVGELNGSEETTIYKSKISQLLGINESLYVKLPRGLLYWNSVNTIYFYVFGTLYILVPSMCALLELGIDAESPESCYMGRMYGGVLITLGITFRNFLIERESRADIAFMLLAVAFMHFIHLIVMVLSGNVQTMTALIRIAVIIGNLIYHAYVDSQGGLHRQLYRWFEDWSPIQYNSYETSPARSVVRERTVAPPLDDPRSSKEEPEDELAEIAAAIATPIDTSLAKSLEEKKQN